jgi:hypothetical protein
VHYLGDADRVFRKSGKPARVHFLTPVKRLLITDLLNGADTAFTAALLAGSGKPGKASKPAVVVPAVVHVPARTRKLTTVDLQRCSDPDAQRADAQAWVARNFIIL